MSLLRARGIGRWLGLAAVLIALCGAAGYWLTRTPSAVLRGSQATASVQKARPAAVVALVPSVKAELVTVSAPAGPAQPPQLTPASELDALMVPVTASGLDAALARAASEQGQALLSSSPKAKQVHLDEIECYHDGCALTLVSNDQRLLVETGDRYVESAKFMAWGGAKFRSGVIDRGNQRFEITWILYGGDARPDSSAALP